MTYEEAKAMCDSEAWKQWSVRERAVFQLNEERLCMPFGEFHKAVEETLERPVWTHEFAHPASLIAELEKLIPAPTMAEIIQKIADIRSPS